MSSIHTVIRLSCNHPLRLNNLLALILNLNTLGAILVSHALLLGADHVSLVGILVTVETDLVPGKLEQVIHALEAATAGLGDGEPDPDTADKGDGGEAPEGSLGGDTAVGDGEKHVGNGARVAVLVGKVKSHGPRGGEGTDAQREQLSGEKVLHGVPAESPTETRDVDHGDGTTASTLAGSGESEAINNAEFGNLGEESSDVDHGNGLESDTGEKSTLTTDDVDEEQGTDQGGAELDDTKHSGDEKRLLATCDTKKLEQVGGVEGDGTGTGPLGEELDH